MCLVSDVPRPGRRLRVYGCVRQIYTLDGLRGFYRGLTASYAGVCGCVCVYVCVGGCMCVCVYVCVCAHACACACVCVRVCVCVCVSEGTCNVHMCMGRE